MKQRQEDNLTPLEAIASLAILVGWLLAVIAIYAAIAPLNP